jgi:hypothetical protein
LTRSFFEMKKNNQEEEDEEKEEGEEYVCDERHYIY